MGDKFLALRDGLDKQAKDCGIKVSSDIFFYWNDDISAEENILVWFGQVFGATNVNILKKELAKTHESVNEIPNRIMQIYEEEALKMEQELLESDEEKKASLRGKQKKKNKPKTQKTEELVAHEYQEIEDNTGSSFSNEIAHAETRDSLSSKPDVQELTQQNEDQQKEILLLRKSLEDAKKSNQCLEEDKRNLKEDIQKLKKKHEARQLKLKNEFEEKHAERVEEREWELRVLIAELEVQKVINGELEFLSRKWKNEREVLKCNVAYEVQRRESKEREMKEQQQKFEIRLREQMNWSSQLRMLGDRSTRY